MFFIVIKLPLIYLLYYSKSIRHDIRRALFTILFTIINVQCYSKSIHYDTCRALFHMLFIVINLTCNLQSSISHIIRNNLSTMLLLVIT